MMITTQPPAVIKLRNIQYFVFPRLHRFQRQSVDTTLSSEPETQSHTPCTLFFFQNLEDLEQRISKNIVTFLKDDVFCEDFLQTVLIRFNDRSTTVATLPPNFSNRFGTKTVSTVEFVASSSALLPGPYFLEEGGIRQAWRCYPDPLAAFVRPIVPQAAENSSRYDDPGFSLYPVPSRLYSEPRSESKPLSGLRFAIKDIIDVSGVPTSNCCRAYEELYGNATSTAPVVQKLIDLGAIPIGKVRTVQFASGAHPMDWVDWQCPFNPRGDGYQSPAMSSSGSAAAVAGYDWLDFSVGTDTFGSITGPAAVCGIYGFRPTTDSQDLSGIVPVSKYLDTVGFFTRSISTATLLAKAWRENELASYEIEKFKNLFYPVDLFPTETPEYYAIVERFVNSLERFLSIRADRRSLKSQWHGAELGDGRPLEEFLESTIPNIQLRDCFSNSEDFRRSYRDSFSKNPYVDPVIQYKWDLSRNVTDEQYQKAIIQKKTFQTWISPNFLRSETNSILLLPAGTSKPTYRDEYYG